MVPPFTGEEKEPCLLFFILVLLPITVEAAMFKVLDMV